MQTRRRIFKLETQLLHEVGICNITNKINKQFNSINATITSVFPEKIFSSLCFHSIYLYVKISLKIKSIPDDYSRALTMNNFCNFMSIE